MARSSAVSGEAEKCRRDFADRLPTTMKVAQRLSTGGLFPPLPRGTWRPGDTFGGHPGGGGVLLAPGGERPGTLVNTLQYTGQLCTLPARLRPEVNGSHRPRSSRGLCQSPHPQFPQQSFPRVECWL